MNANKKRHFFNAERNLRIGKAAVHAHRTTMAETALLKAIRHISAVLLDLRDRKDSEKKIKRNK